jgi:hypothetical protein
LFSFRAEEAICQRRNIKVKKGSANAGDDVTEVPRTNDSEKAKKSLFRPIIDKEVLCLGMQRLQVEFKAPRMIQEQKLKVVVISKEGMQREKVV